MQRIGKGKYILRKANTNVRRDRSGELAAKGQLTSKLQEIRKIYTIK